MGFVLISVSKCRNNTQKRLKAQNSKCGYHYRAFYRSDLGGVRTVTISKMQAIKLKAILFLKKEHNIRSNKVKILRCDQCGLEQENNGQKTCLECQQ